MKYSWLIFCLSCWITVGDLSAQSITITRLVILPKRTTLSKPLILYLGKDQKEIKLTYEQNDFYVYFQATNVPPTYDYQLKDGYVKYDVRTANQYAFFTNIPNGKYVFTVRSIVRPNLPPAQLIIRVESPIWLQWWFLPMLFLYALLLVGVILYFLYRYRLRQLMRVQVVRENIARDLHDDMGSYLSSISVLSQSVENLVQIDPKRSQVLVQKIGEIARQVMDSMDDIIWSVNPDNDTMIRIGVRIRDVGADLLEEQAIVFTLNLDDKILQSYLPLELRRDFFLIYKEALSNIVKYAQASHVWVKLQRRESILELTIQDDGIGFDVQQSARNGSAGGNGIKNMRSRAQKMGGTLHINSTPGQGTLITLRILSF